MKYPYSLLGPLCLLGLTGEPPPVGPGLRLITGTLHDGTSEAFRSTIYVGDSLRRVEERLHQQAEQLGEALKAPGRFDTLAPAWQQWRRSIQARNRLRHDPAYFTYSDAKTGRFRLRARPTDTLHIEAPGHVGRHLRVADLPRHGRNLRLGLPLVPCIPYAPCTDTTGQQYIFIGRRLSLRRVEEPCYTDAPLGLIPNNQFTARYQLLAQLQGRYPRDTMTFTVYDHYGEPAFRRYEYVLLFVQAHCGELIHRKYQYYPVYRTTDGRWAVASWWRPNRKPVAARPIQPHAVPFAQPPSIDVSRAEPAYVARHFPAPYYRVEHGRAMVQYGYYVEEQLANRRREQ